MNESFTTRLFEVASRSRGGKRHIKLIVHRIMENENDWQENGISWKEEYVLNAIKNDGDPMPIAVEYLKKGQTADETEIAGHGLEGKMEDADGNPMPVYNEDSEVVGAVTGLSIKNVLLNGEETRVLLADGVLYEHRCRGLVEWLKQNVPNGNVMGSVEIVGLPENENKIIYEDGYKEKGRVPKEYAYSGYSILSFSVPPADDTCFVLEVNNKEGNALDEKVLREAIDEIKNELHTVLDKNETLTAELNEKTNTLAEANAKVDELQAALEAVNKELAELREAEERAYQEREDKWQALRAEKEALMKELGEMKAKERIAALETALQPFSNEQREAASEQIAAFKADPVNSEINTVTDAIYLAIGKQRVEEQREPEDKENTDEQNELHEDIDIFSDIFTPAKKEQGDEDVSIF